MVQGRELGQGHAELEILQQENEALKAQMARLSAQLLDVGHSTNFNTPILVFLPHKCIDLIMVFYNQDSYTLRD